MNRLLITVISLLVLAVGLAQWQNMNPPAIQHYLDTRAIEQQSRASGGQESMMSSQFAPTHVVNGVEMVDAFIGFDNESVVASLKSNGVQVYCVFDDFVTARIPVNSLTRVANLPGVTDVEISRMMELCTDTTLSVTHAGQLLNGIENGLPQNYDGSGVIVGVIDAGFDYQHIAFRDQNDRERRRIVRIYDPEDSTGYMAMVNNDTLPGSVIMGDRINTIVRDGSGTHGTITTSIAAGSHSGPYGGMAPGADIVLCVSRNLNIGLSEVEVINCIKYIYAYADSVGKPCVINVSLSTAHGPHDGKDRVSRAIAQSVGPGRIFVIAAGNNGNSMGYCHGPVTIEKPLNFLLGYDYINADESYYYMDTWFDTWVRAVNVRPLAKLHILDKLTSRIVWQSDMINLSKMVYASDVSDYFESGPQLPYEGYMKVIISQSFTGKYELAVTLRNLRNKSYTVDEEGKIGSRYQIGVSIYAPKLIYPRQPDSCYVDSWACTGQGRRSVWTRPVSIDEVTEDGDTVTQTYNNFYAGASNACTIGTYAVGDSAISVGAFAARNRFFSLGLGYEYFDYNHKFLGAAAYFSSFQVEGYGPTATALPTVMAPGTNVVAAISRYSSLNNDKDDFLVMRSEDGSPWSAQSGTSMATPAVAGIIALWLQANPNLSPGDIKNIIAQTAIKDEFTLDNPRFGPNGKIDAMAGMRLILGDELQPLLPGDVNGDGRLSINDVSILIQYFLNESAEAPDCFNAENADANQDGRISIKDLTLLVYMLLESTPDPE